VTLFERTTPDLPTNSAVCYDCHGVHNILPATDENSQVLKENLLATCRQCHPDASTNFPDAWMSHFRPSLEHYPVVYFVDLFYQILIPTLVGGFVLFIATDVARRGWDRRSRRRAQAEDIAATEAPSVDEVQAGEPRGDETRTQRNREEGNRE
jgi:hypothetical protein